MTSWPFISIANAHGSPSLPSPKKPTFIEFCSCTDRGRVARGQRTRETGARDGVGCAPTSAAPTDKDARRVFGKHARARVHRGMPGREHLNYNGVRAHES